MLTHANGSRENLSQINEKSKCLLNILTSKISLPVYGHHIESINLIHLIEKLNPCDPNKLERFVSCPHIPKKAFLKSISW